jgi:Ca2+-binding RTX toxin-like protein
MDLLHGWSGDDVLWLRGDSPTANRQHAYGGAGDDYFNSSADDESFFGGRGNDTVAFHFPCRDCGAEYPDPRIGVIVDLRLSGPQDTIGRGVDELSSVENLSGTGDDDVLLGDGEKNRLDGYWGDDILNGRRGADHLRGGPGTDRCIGGPGRDLLRLCE